MMALLFVIILIAIGVFSFALSCYICFFKLKANLTSFYRCLMTLALGLLLFALLFTAVMFLIWPPVV
ncbi:hypothetical protein [Carboxydothermus pertinax]|uniref:hypothetical protein n=1 Tax=Carboxydothermus pertinax TaxID=870242 RepID=UPI0011774893|nr:hypothetical protein [Carboxydothermus pertinax]